LGDSVPEEPADPVVLLEDRYGMPGPSELLGSGKPGGTRSYDRDRLSGPLGGDHGLDEPVLPRMAHDLELDVLDGHRIVVDPENAGSLARRRTDLPGELGEIVRGVEAMDRLVPLAPVDQIVPVGNHVAERAASPSAVRIGAEGDAAIHAARRLIPDDVVGHLVHHLLEVAQSLLDGAIRRTLPLDLEKSGRL